MSEREMESAMPRRPSSSAAVTALPMRRSSAALPMTLGFVGFAAART